MKLGRIAAFLVVASAAALAVTPEEAALRIEQKIRSLRSLTADYEHLYYSMMISDPLSERGTFAFSPPDRMRWESLEPERQIFIYKDGVFQLYIPAENQLIRSRSSGEKYESEILAIFTGTKSLRDDYTVESSPFPTDDPGAVQIKLTPKKEGDFAYILLEADPGDWLIRKAVFFDDTGNKQEYRFSRIRTGRKLSPRLFELAVPQECEILEQDAGAGD
jgi:outer membrane lipoprotein carrier protein